ncbi:MAG: transposase [Pseudomonadota bacterium]
MTQPYKTYTDEFKQEAVRLALNSTHTKSQIARDLGISVSLLYAWMNKFDAATSRGLSPADVAAEQTELRQLKAQVKQLKIENDILKKAAGYFARDQV